MMDFQFPKGGHMDSFPATWIHAKVISLEIILRACLLDGKRGTTGLVVVAWGSMAFRWPSDPWKTNGWRAPKVDVPWKRWTPFKILAIFLVSMLDFGGVIIFFLGEVFVRIWCFDSLKLVGFSLECRKNKLKEATGSFPCVFQYPFQIWHL